MLCQHLHLAAVLHCCVHSACNYNMFIVVCTVHAITTCYIAVCTVHAFTTCYIACNTLTYTACHVDSGLSRSSAPNPYTSSHAHMPSARRSSSMRADSRNLSPSRTDAVEGDHAGQHLLILCMEVLCGIYMLLSLVGRCCMIEIIVVIFVLARAHIKHLARLTMQDGAACLMLPPWCRLLGLPDTALLRQCYMKTQDAISSCLHCRSCAAFSSRTGDEGSSQTCSEWLQAQSANRLPEASYKNSCEGSSCRLAPQPAPA